GAPAASDKLVPLQCATPPAAWRRRPPDAEIAFGGEVSCRTSLHIIRSPRRRGRFWPLCVRAPWQAHGEHRAFAVLARHSHVATHHARELARDGETEPRAAELLRSRGIGLGELLEQLSLLLPGHAHTSVGDGELDEVAAIA